MKTSLKQIHLIYVTHRERTYEPQENGKRIGWKEQEAWKREGKERKDGRETCRMDFTTTLLCSTKP